jgi:hypothetical protein
LAAEGRAKAHFLVPDREENLEFTVAVSIDKVVLHVHGFKDPDPIQELFYYDGKLSYNVEVRSPDRRVPQVTTDPISGKPFAITNIFSTVRL